MKRFHVHLSVPDLDASIRFYTQMFGAPPSVAKPDYAKWMLDDPRVNFAISSRDGKPGLNHLGFQVDSDQELQAMREQAMQADLAVVDEAGAACCYARSDKHWIQDPQGIAWETFHTLGSIPLFGSAEPASAAPEASACCAPKTGGKPLGIPVAVESAPDKRCCG